MDTHIHQQPMNSERQNVKKVKKSLRKKLKKQKQAAV
jgi:hypothetical protein